MPFSRASLYEHDRTWAWKAILRAFAIIFNIIGIGLTAWAVAVGSRGLANTNDNYYYYTDDTYAIPWNLITFSLSFIWCLANLCILLVHSKWIHPGANVGCDLLLWLAFIVTALYSTAGVVQDLVWSDNYDNYGSSTYTSGSTTYAHYPNGTEYEVTPSHPAPPCPGFDSCAERDAVLGARHKRGVVITVATALAFLLLLIHFALFISACRYTHGRRKSRGFSDKLKSETEKIEENIIRRLEAEGRLRTPPPAMASTALETQTASGAVGADQLHMGGGSGSVPPPEIRLDPASPAGHGSLGQPHSTRHEGVVAPAPLRYPDRGQGIEAEDRITRA